MHQLEAVQHLEQAGPRKPADRERAGMRGGEDCGEGEGSERCINSRLSSTSNKQGPENLPIEGRGRGIERRGQDIRLVIRKVQLSKAPADIG